MNLRDAVRSNADFISEASNAEMRNVIQVLKSVREETATQLEKFLSKREETTPYNLHQHQTIMLQLRHAITEVEHKLPHAMTQDLHGGARKAMDRSLESLKRVVAAGSKKFGTQPLRLDKAALIRGRERTLIHKFPTSARRYAGRVGMNIRHQFAVGLVKGESVGQLVNRLMRVTKPVAARKSDKQKSALVADNAFFRSKADAERLVRTEMVNAANAIQVDSLIADNREAGGDGGWLKRWDATHDKRTCAFCEEMDGVVAAAEEPFAGPFGPIDYPPAHPMCRCSCSPWRAEWGFN